MIHLRHIIEGLLDSDDLEHGAESAIIDEWLSTNAKGNFKVKSSKKFGYIDIKGDIKISTPDNRFPPLNIHTVEGSIYIENCPNIVNLDGLFDEYATVKGDLCISRCPLLQHLIGCPEYVENWVKITDCKSLRSLEGFPRFALDISVMKCAKRFKKDSIKKLAPQAVHIYCGEEGEEPNILEALSDPILIRLWDFMKTLKHRPKSLAKTLPSYACPLDQLTPSDCTTYNLLTDQAKAVKALRGLLQGKIDKKYGSGIAIIEDENENFVWMITSQKHVYNFEYGMCRYTTDERTNEILGYIDNYNINHYKLKYMHIYDTSSSDDVRNLQRSREESKKGMINTDPESLARYVRDNRARYKAAVTKLKAARASDKYMEVAKKVENVWTRFSKIPTKCLKDMDWYKTNRYNIDSLTDVMTGQDKYIGLLGKYKNWVDSVVDITLKGESWVSNMDRYTEELMTLINRADVYLTKISL